MSDNPLLNALAHPVTLVMGSFASIVHFAQIPMLDAVGAVVWNNAGMIFTAVSIGGSQFAAQFGWVSSATVNALMLVAGALFLAKILDELWDKLQRRLKQS